MPFINESGNADNEYLSDGMTESLISSLSQIPKLNVKARSSVFRYKGKEMDLSKIAQDLNVQAILNGRVLQRGEQLILNLELVEAKTENVIWSEQYNRKQTDLISLQSEIASDVSHKLKTKLTGAEEQKVSKNYTANPEAYQLYLKGRFYWNKRTTKDLRKSIDYFNQAVGVDPTFALAYAALADGYAILWSYGGAPANEAMPKAREFALKALSLDSDLAEARAALGYVFHFYDHNFVEAEREYKLSIELNPQYATAHLWYGELLQQLGKNEEAMREKLRALEHEPLSLIFNRHHGESLLFSHRYDEAITQFKKTVELDPNFASTYTRLAIVYQLQGKYAESVEGIAKQQEIIGEPQTAQLLRESFAKGGWHGFLRFVTKEPPPANFSSYYIATLHTALGEKDRAFANLNKSYENREYFIVYLKVDPRLDPLRFDPRFNELLRRVGLPQ
jgi:TolB-like protein